MRAPTDRGGPKVAASGGAVGRLPWILFLLSAALPVLAYPLRLRGERPLALIESLRERAADSAAARFALDQFESIVSSQHSPLPLKGALGAVCLVGGVLVFGAFAVARGRAGAGGSGSRGSLNGRIAAAAAWASLPAFGIWCALTTLHSPTRGISLEAVAWLWAGLAGGYVLLRRGVTPGDAEQISLLLVLLGGAVATVAALQAVQDESGFIFAMLPRFDAAEDSRNAFGSLIGHGTHLASFVLMTMFPAISFLVISSLNRVRLALVAWLALCVFVILIARSRAIWILAPLLLPLHLAILHRRLPPGPERRRIPRLCVALALLAAAGVGSQLVRAPWTASHTGGRAFTERLRLFRPAEIAKGTRARILVCSVSLLREAPLVGHGFHSFRAVYPIAQAEWFAAHPDTRLGATVLRTERAHNEYLQTWIETGAVGLGLMILVLGEVALRGRRAGRKLTEPRHIAIHTAMGLAALAVALHALTDFPFRLPMLGIPWLLCAAAFGAYRPTGNSEVADRAPADEGEGSAAGAGAEEADGADAPKAARALRWGSVYRIFNGIFIVSLAPLFTAQFVLSYQADLNYMKGQAQVESLRSGGEALPAGERRKLALAAEERFLRAVSLRRDFELAWYGLGMTRAALGYMQYEDDLRQGGLPGGARPLVKSFFQEALLNYERVTRTLPFHDAWREMARCEEYMWHFSVGPARREHAEREAANLRRALYLAPALSEAALRLDERLSSEPDPDPEELLALRRDIRRYNRAFFDRHYGERFAEMHRWGDRDGAVVGAEILLDVDPDDPWHLRFAIDVFMAAGDRDRVTALARRLRELPGGAGGAVHPYRESLANVYEAVIGGDPGEVARALDHHGREGAERLALLRSLERGTDRESGAGGATSGADPFEKPDGVPPDDWARLTAETDCLVLYRVYHDLPAALAALRVRESMSGPPPPLETDLQFAWLALDAGDAGLYDRLALRIDSRAGEFPADPGHPARAARRAQERAREALSAEPGESAAEARRGANPADGN